MLEDLIVAEVRKYREENAAKFGFNVRAIADDAKKREEQSGRKVVSFAEEEAPAKKTANKPLA
jgi:hypothetical protein